MRSIVNKIHHLLLESIERVVAFGGQSATRAMHAQVTRSRGKVVDDAEDDIDAAFKQR